MTFLTWHQQPGLLTRPTTDPRPNMIVEGIDCFFDLCLVYLLGRIFQSLKFLEKYLPWGCEAHCFAASTILAVASANSLAAVRRRLCYDIVEKRERKFVNTKISREIRALFLFFIIDMIFVIWLSMLRRILMCFFLVYFIRWV